MTTSTETLVGTELVVEVGPVAHGGHHVARHDGRVIFVRHAITGETVRVKVTEGESTSRFLRADAIEVLTPSPHRVIPPCAHAGPGLCGGCDFQHVSPAHQRTMLAAVVAEQLQRLAGITWEGVVESVPGDDDGLRWRTRVRFRATSDGVPGLLKHRSEEVVAIDKCEIAHPHLPDAKPAIAAGHSMVQTVISGTGDTAVVTDPTAAPLVRERAAGHSFQVHAGDFWQVHPGAADALTAAVVEGLAPRPGERCWDLYAGVGLFAAALIDRVGETGAVVAVESHSRSVGDLRANLAEHRRVRVVQQRVDRYVRGRAAQGGLDLVVLDPPRSGAGRDVVSALARRHPRAIGYVACDPATLARDLATFAKQGYLLDSLRAFDIFPMTHHVECVAILTRS